MIRTKPYVFLAALVLALGSISLNAALLNDRMRIEDEFERLRMRERINVVVLQKKLEPYLEASKPTKENLLSSSAVLKDLVAIADTSFDRKAITALKDVLDHLSSAFTEPDAGLYLRELEKVQKGALPAHQGHDHRLFATGIVVASISRGLAQRSRPDEKAIWYYVAGEAQFVATKSGTKDFEEFLKLAAAKEQDRISQAKARLESIKTLDRER